MRRGEEATGRRPEPESNGDTRIFNPRVGGRRGGNIRLETQSERGRRSESQVVSGRDLFLLFSRPILKVMQAPATGVPKSPASDESPAEALVRLLEQHGLEDSLREILAAIQARRQAGQKEARLALLEHLLEGHPPLTEAELAAVRDE
jgi:hypothetical protein